ncbi:hypothetical protein MXD81_05625 [Microbacteriaceae bacterium K1510]|nr:hypothetical protein [Microbacteriaceae bacterium K1510]
MDRFICRENIERYRRLLAQTTDEEQRRQLMKLLAEEEARDQDIARMTGPQVQA